MKLEILDRYPYNMYNALLTSFQNMFSFLNMFWS